MVDDGTLWIIRCPLHFREPRLYWCESEMGESDIFMRNIYQCILALKFKKKWFLENKKISNVEVFKNH